MLSKTPGSDAIFHGDDYDEDDVDEEDDEETKQSSAPT